MARREQLSRKQQQVEAGEAEFLRAVGERIREARSRRGMSRRILARDSAVSERYLAQLEAGLGNISIALLRQIAHAMGLPIADLVREGPDRPVELTLLMQTLGRLSAQELSQARKLLTGQFGSAAERERHHRVALIGLRGAGKSTLGTRLAKDLRVPFIELDREIEREAGAKLGEIFDLYGQAAYRRYERRALDSVIERYDHAVIATGGSLVSEAATFDLLLSACYTIWLTADPEEHMARVIAQGDFRPMAGNEEAMDDLRRILIGRNTLYSKADATVNTSGKKPEQSYKELRALVGDLSAS
ncbi:MAG TPA: helix-turn-helix transcriptional regulator [Alphaproteobacteria bacterium]|nr:helix-turn-helix transcriptional regulator [Alphaproteobacteria bacterium]